MGSLARRQESGSILILVMILSMLLAFGVTFLLQQAEVEARATRVRLGSIRALYSAYAALENAKTVIAASSYDAQGRNSAVSAALSRPDRTIEGTNVVVDPLNGADGSWYTMTATVPYADVHERVVSQAFRTIDFFSSYNLFVAEDPAGISGSPVGAIHSNEQVQFYFPGGSYRHSVTAVDGVVYKSGATPENTSILGPFNPAVARIDIDYDGSDRYSLRFIEGNTSPDFNFDDTLDTRLRLYESAGKQWVNVERWTKPRVETVSEEYVSGYRDVNPRDETYTYTVRVSDGFQTRTRDVQVFDRYETVTENVQVAVYVDDTRTVNVPVYRTETRTRDVPIYRDEVRYRTVTRNVWIPLEGGTGGTAVGGDGGNLGYWAPQDFQEPYTVRVIDRYETQTYTVNVVDHYDSRVETYRRFDHYDTVPRSRQVTIYRTETQSYQQEIFHDETRTGTRTVYDREPIISTRVRTNYLPGVRQSTKDAELPENGLLFVGGDVKALSGDIVDRVTLACLGSITVTGNLLYRDAQGDTAYQHGTEPWLPYEPNSAYDGHSILGIIAQQDILYSRLLPDNTEMNASMLAIKGRVGIEGIALDDEGEVSAFNQLLDEYGRPTAQVFRKNSIRRLGGITTAKRPVETVVQDGAIRSGFNVGQSVFDIGLLEGPPPFFLAYPIPRFFSTTISK